MLEKANTQKNCQARPISSRKRNAFQGGKGDIIFRGKLICPGEVRADANGGGRRPKKSPGANKRDGGGLPLTCATKL